MDITDSRHRLVVASQALELDHLQALIRNRDSQAQRTEENLLKLIDESRKDNDRLLLENEELKKCLGVLNTNLRAIQAKGGDDAAEREAVRILRNKVSSLEEEREVLLDKIVAERTCVRAPFQGCCDAYTQTSDLGYVLDDPNQTVEGIRSALELEQDLKDRCNQLAAVHASNVAILQEQLQRRVEHEVRRLQAEQDAYARLLGDLCIRSDYQEPTPQREPFMRQQEGEMLNLRKRLNELQVRHQTEDHVEDRHVTGALKHSAILQRMLVNASRSSTK